MVALIRSHRQSQNYWVTRHMWTNSSGFFEIFRNLSTDTNREGNVTRDTPPEYAKSCNRIHVRTRIALIFGHQCVREIIECVYLFIIVILNWYHVLLYRNINFIWLMQCNKLNNSKKTKYLEWAIFTNFIFLSTNIVTIESNIMAYYNE